MVRLEITLTRGNIKNSHFYLTSCLKSFPSDVIGGPNKASTAPRGMEIHWPFGDPVITDVDADKRIFRKRSWVTRLFEGRSAREGDTVVIEKLGPYEIKVDIERLGKDIKPMSTMNVGTTIQIHLNNPSWLERNKYEVPVEFASIFPKDALGARGQADQKHHPEKGIPVEFDYGVAKSLCDVATRASGAMRPRDNKGMRQFLEANKAQTGDIISITRTGDRSYKVALIKGTR